MMPLDLAEAITDSRVNSVGKTFDSSGSWPVIASQVRSCETKTRQEAGSVGWSEAARCSTSERLR